MEKLKTLEFYVTPDGSVYYKEPGKESRRLTKFNTDIIDYVNNRVKKNWPECYSALSFVVQARRLPYRRPFHTLQLRRA